MSLTGLTLPQCLCLSQARTYLLYWFMSLSYLYLENLSSEFVTRSWIGVLDTTLCDKVCQWLATGRWFSLGTPVSSTNKTDCHDITEILLKVALNTINQPVFRDRMSEWVIVWLLFNVIWAIFQLYHGEKKLHLMMMVMIMSAVYFIFIVQALRNHSLRIDMSLHLHTLSWFWANQSLLWHLKTMCLVEKQQILILYSLVWQGLEPTIYSTRGKHSNNCTTDYLQIWLFYLLSIVIL